MQLFKNILPKESINEILMFLEKYSDEWERNHLVVPSPSAMRMKTDIKKFPVIEEFYKQHFSYLNLSLSKGNRIYFTSYKENSKCLPHVDPCNTTIIMVLKKALEGGELVVENKQFDLEEGDALVFDAKSMHSINPIIKGERLSLSIWLY